MACKKKIKILHILPSLQCGGTETWLLHLMENIDRSKYQLDFLIRATEHCFYEDRFRNMGANIYRVPGKVNGRRRPLRYLYGIRKTLIKEGPYDVIHCHDGFNSGLYVWMAKTVGIPVRIVHAHNDYLIAHDEKSIVDAGMTWLKGRMIKASATHGLACSAIGASALFGKRWEADQRWQIFYCGLDLKPFYKKFNKSALRKELGIPTDTIVVGHVGRFDEQKNHKKLISIFGEVIKKRPNAYLLLVGDGILRPVIEEQAGQLGLSERVVFAGIRSDVSELMLGAMDIFLFPSLFEGLGLVLVEAQAAGLPCVISNVIPKEADVVPNLVTRMPLASSDAMWAEKILKDVDGARNSIDSAQFKRFNIELSAATLAEIYEDASRR